MQAFWALQVALELPENRVNGQASWALQVAEEVPENFAFLQAYWALHVVDCAMHTDNIEARTTQRITVFADILGPVTKIPKLTTS